MKYFKGLLILMALCAVIKSQAQINGEIKVYDNNDTSKRVLAKQYVSPKTLETMMKFDIWLLFTGDLPVFIEQQINEHISIEAAPGITFYNVEADLAQGNTTTFSKLFYYPVPDVDGYKMGLGYSFKADMRYYFGNNMMDGMYLSPQIDLRHYVLNYPDIGGVSGNSMGTYSKGYTNTLYVIAAWGIETDEIWPFGCLLNGDYASYNLGASGSRDKGFYSDYSLGLGLRVITGKQGVNTSEIVNGTS